MSKHISLDSKLLFIFIPTEGGVQREFLETGSNSVFSRKGNLQKVMIKEFHFSSILKCVPSLMSEKFPNIVHGLQYN